MGALPFEPAIVVLGCFGMLVNLNLVWVGHPTRNKQVLCRWVWGPCINDALQGVGMPWRSAWGIGLFQKEILNPKRCNWRLCYKLKPWLGKRGEATIQTLGKRNSHTWWVFIILLVTSCHMTTPAHLTNLSSEVSCLPAPLLRCCCRHIAPKYLNTSICHNALCPTKVWYVWHQGMSVFMLLTLTKSHAAATCFPDLERPGPPVTETNSCIIFHEYWMHAKQNRLETPHM